MLRLENLFLANNSLDAAACFSCSLDLQLAAELGKALLERNVDLEAQLHSLQQTSSEQESEITVRLLV